MEATLYLNLEEPLFSSPSYEILDVLYEIYQENVYPGGRAYIFLDEVQEVPGWERWMRVLK